MVPTIEYLTKYFNIYNKLYFYSKLPLPRIVLKNSKCTLGEYHPMSKTIGISQAYDGEECFFHNTLIHEMIHYYLDFTNDEDMYFCHGTHFKREAARINKYGWHISRCATDEEMSLAKLVKKPQSKRKVTITPLLLLSKPFSEEELVNFILHSNCKDKDVMLWLSYPTVQNMVYAELHEDDCIEVHQKLRCQAIEKAYKILIDFNYGNDFYLYVLHNDLASFYCKIGFSEKAELEMKKSIAYKGSNPTTFIIIHGKNIEPIKFFE